MPHHNPTDHLHAAQQHLTTATPRGAVSFERRCELPMEASELFAWHEREGAFQRLSPPWDPVEVLHQDSHISDGARVALKIKLPLGVKARLEVTHEDYLKGERFVDRQLKGPFSFWRHVHLVTPSETPSESTPRSTLTDHIDYKLPLGPLGSLFGGGLACARLEQLFHYRHEVMRHDTLLHQLAVLTPTVEEGGVVRRRKVAVSGASGFVGEPLCALLSTGGFEVVRLVRGTPKSSGERAWSKAQEVPDLSDIDAVIHLAGESVAQRWTARAKAKIMESRVARTRALSEALARAAQAGAPHPKHLICASAVGYYGDHQDPTSQLTEGAPLGEGFLAEVCEAWEGACEPAREAGVRVVNVRVGVVLAPNGGALERLLLPFSLGAGGPVGHGRQGLSWVSLHDVVGAFYWALTQPALEGVLNATAPEPVSSAGFARALGKVLKRPAFMPTPGAALKLAFGEMAQEVLLQGAFVRPERLLSSGYPFMHTSLEAALRFELGRVEL